MPTTPALNTTNTPSDVRIERDEHGVSVDPVWYGVDRPDTGGWYVKDMTTAARLERALRAGVALRNEGVRTDVNGHTYMDTTHLVSARTMNADLRRLGF